MYIFFGPLYFEASLLQQLSQYPNQHILLCSFPVSSNKNSSIKHVAQAQWAQSQSLTQREGWRKGRWFGFLFLVYKVQNLRSGLGTEESGYGLSEILKNQLRTFRRKVRSAAANSLSWQVSPHLFLSWGTSYRCGSLLGCIGRAKNWGGTQLGSHLWNNRKLLAAPRHHPVPDTGLLKPL